jgi:hypothetical protein
MPQTLDPACDLSTPEVLLWSLPPAERNIHTISFLCDQRYRRPATYLDNRNPYMRQLQIDSVAPKEASVRTL